MSLKTFFFFLVEGGVNARDNTLRAMFTLELKVGIEQLAGGRGRGRRRLRIRKSRRRVEQRKSHTKRIKKKIPPPTHTHRNSIQTFLFKKIHSTWTFFSFFAFGDV